MFECPVCGTPYPEKIPEFCSVCDWQLKIETADLDQVRLQWAKKTWDRFNYNLNFHRISEQLDQLQTQIQQASQERADLQNQLDWVLYHFQVLNPESLNDTLSRLENRLENLTDTGQSWSEVGMDYSYLIEQLESRDWQTADEYTWQIILSIAGRQEQGWLQAEDIDRFPCTDLKTIDYFWHTYSQGLFGLTIQHQIWETVAGQYDQFCDQVGWREKENWKYYEELKFVNAIPAGHFPVITWRKRACYGVGSETAATNLALYFQRLNHCNDCES